MRQYILFCIAFLVISIEISAQYVFSVEKSVKYTPIEDQQSTNTCWAFATNSFLESELLRESISPVNLSEMYIVRQVYIEKARRYLHSKGKSRFAEGGLSHDVIHAFSSYGAMPEDYYPGKASNTEVHNHAELVTVLQSVLDAMLTAKTVSDKWLDVINAILDVYLDPVPENFMIGEQVFTPNAFANSLGLTPTDYVSITSFAHHPFYDKFVLDIPDNHANEAYYNVPLADFLRVTKNAIDKGYSIAWDGDASESAFSAEHGIAILPESEREDVFITPGKEKVVTQEERQLQFENAATTDDHLMHVTGTAVDQNGNRYFILKNSWGEIGAFSGILYMSETYFLTKTIAIMVHRDAIPADIAAKMHL